MKPTPHRFQRGFSLVEVTLALGLAGFCLIALFGLLPIGVASNQATLAQTAAASMAAAVVSDLRATDLAYTVTPSPQFAIPVEAVQTNGTNGTRHTLFLRDDGTAAIASGAAPASAVDADADPAQDPRYRVTLTFFPPPASTASSVYRAATLVRVRVTWPALADPTNSVDPTRFAGSFDTITALDRH